MRASGDVIVAETATVCTIAKWNGHEIYYCGAARCSQAGA
jgi:hypothetical protein